MKTKHILTSMLAFLFLGMTVSCDKIKEILEPDISIISTSFVITFSPNTPLTGIIPLDNGVLTYYADTTTLRTDSLFRLRIGKESSDSAEVIISYDGVEKERSRVFPYYCGMKISDKGEHEIFIKAGIIREGSDSPVIVDKKGSIKFEVK